MRHAISVGIAVLIAMLVNYFVMKGANDWIIWSAFLVSLPTNTAPLRERAVLTILLFAALSLVAIEQARFPIYVLLFQQMIMLDVPIVLGVLFVTLALPLSNWQTDQQDFWLLSFFSILLIALLLPGVNIHAAMTGSIIGAFIGILCGGLVFTTHFSQEFSRGVLPTLQALDKNLHGLQTVLSTQDFADTDAKSKMLQRICISQQPAYPEWVFEAGFNPGLRSGSRFFLIKLEQAQETVCALNYLVLRDLQMEIVQDSANLIIQSLQGNRDLLHVLSHYFATQTLLPLQQNFTEDITALEAAVQNIVPPKIELLDIAPEFLALTACVRELKDLRHILLALTAALPAAQVVADTHRAPL